MDAILCIIGGCLFLAGFTAHIYVRVRLNPKNDPELDDYYYEFEDQHPGLMKYTRWSRITFNAAVAGALLLFLALLI